MQDLNQWVAENVLGYEAIFNLNCGKMLSKLLPDLTYEDVIPLKDYSPTTNLNQALEALEKWLEKNDCFIDGGIFPVSIQHKYQFAIKKEQYICHIDDILADSLNELPLAICEKIKEVKLASRNT